MGNKGNQMMNKTLTLLMGAAIAVGSLAIASAADAQVLRRYDQYRFYAPQRVYPERFYESPTYAPDSPAPRNYDNPGIPDFQMGSRG